LTPTSVTKLNRNPVKAVVAAVAAASGPVAEAAVAVRVVAVASVLVAVAVVAVRVVAVASVLAVAARTPVVAAARNPVAAAVAAARNPVAAADARNQPIQIVRQGSRTPVRLFF
jgi:hypothetical protein